MAYFEREREQESCWHWLWFTVSYLWASPTRPHLPTLALGTGNYVKPIIWFVVADRYLSSPVFPACLNSLIPSQQELPPPQHWVQAHKRAREVM